VVSADKMRFATQILNVAPANALVIAQEKRAETMDAAFSVAHVMRTNSAMAFPNVSKPAFLIAPTKHVETTAVGAPAERAPQDIFAKHSNALKQSAPPIAKEKYVETMGVGTPVESVWATRFAMKNFNVRALHVFQTAMEKLVARTDVAAPAGVVPRDKIVLISNAGPANVCPPAYPINNAAKMDVAAIAVSAEAHRNVTTMSA
jgi:hypothetical protein